MIDSRTESTCELCETSIVNGTAGWRHIVSMVARGGCGLALPPALPVAFDDVEPLEPLVLASCGGAGKSGGGCTSCG